MIKYMQISDTNYWALKDKSGYYCFTFNLCKTYMFNR